VVLQTYAGGLNMGETEKDLTQEHFTAIGEYVRGHIHEWIRPRTDLSISERELDLRERTIRVEESLKQGFKQSEFRYKQSDKRFKDLIHQMDKRFKQVDKHFEQTDKRFRRMLAHSATGIIFLGLIMTIYKFLV
jgi:mannosyltransferase OCH1-like enzyme